jgi:hypothetical protein
MNYKTILLQTVNDTIDIVRGMSKDEDTDKAVKNLLNVKYMVENEEFLNKEELNLASVNCKSEHFPWM